MIFRSYRTLEVVKVPVEWLRSRVNVIMKMVRPRSAYEVISARQEIIADEILTAQHIHMVVGCDEWLNQLG